MIIYYIRNIIVRALLKHYRYIQELDNSVLKHNLALTESR